MARLAQANSSVSQKADAQGANPLAITGLWLTSYLIGGQIVDQGFELWHDDGTEILIDTAPPATDNVCVGVWVQTAPLTYQLTHPSWTFDLNGNLTGTAMIRNVVIMERGGNKFTGTFTVDLFNNSGQQIDHFEGQLSATRIKPS